MPAGPYHTMFSSQVLPSTSGGHVSTPLLFSSFSALQRREDIFIAGQSEADGGQWVMSMGHFMGLFDKDWLGIAPTHKLATLRYAEFNCVKDGKIIQSGFFVDIIGLMMQVGLNPLPLPTGQYFTYPGPRTHDGIRLGKSSDEQSEKTMALVNHCLVLFLMQYEIDELVVYL